MSINFVRDFRPYRLERLNLYLLKWAGVRLLQTYNQPRLEILTATKKGELEIWVKKLKNYPSFGR